MNMQNLLKLIEEHGNRPAICSRHLKLTYRQLKDQLYKTSKRIGTQPRDHIIRLEVGRKPTDIISILACFLAQRHCAPTNPRLAPDTPGSIGSLPEATILIRTSGSTGLPKWAVLTSTALLTNASGALHLHPSGDQDRYLMNLPFYHVGGIGAALRALLSGAELIFSEEAVNPESLQSEQISHLSMVPTQLIRMINSQQLPLPDLKQILLGGGPCPEHILEKSAHLPVFPTYGLTEMGAQVVTRGVDKKDHILPDRDLKISESQEILVKGPTLFSGYLSGNTLNLPVDEKGWFHTRDAAQWVDDRLQIIGRMDNMFISGGENIQPEYIESLLNGISGIIESIVVPVPDSQYGQRPFAFVRCKNGLTLPQLEESVRANLPGYLCPVRIEAWAGNGGIKANRLQLKLLAREMTQ